MSESDSASLIPEAEAAKELHGSRALAEAAGMSPDTLYRVLRGEDVSRRTLRRLAEGVRKLSESDVSRDKPDAGAGASVTLPLHVLAYWRGILESEARHLTGMSQSLAALSQSVDAIRATLATATAGVTGFVESGVLPPAPSPPPPPAPEPDRPPVRDAPLEMFTPVPDPRVADQAKRRKGGA